MRDLMSLLGDLAENGIRVWTENGALHYRGVKGKIAQDVVAEIRARKPDLLEFLGRHGAAPAPLTSIQSAVLQIAHRVADPFRCLATGFRLKGAWNSEMLRRSIQTVIHRHASLRTRIITIGANSYQQVDQPADFQLPIVEVAAARDEDVEQAAARLVQQFIDQTIQLDAGPLFDARIFRLAPDHQLLIFRADHIIADATSLAVLFHEVLIFYFGYLQGSPPALALPPSDMVDVAYARNHAHTSWLEEHSPYWLAKFAGAPRSSFPADALTGSPGPGVFERKIRFGPQLTARLRALSRRLGATLSSTLFTLYVELMRRCCGENDLVVCLYVRGRNRAEHMTVVGLFAHLLFLRLRFDATWSFAQMLNHVNEELAEALKHDDLGQLPLLMPDLQSAGSFNWQTLNTPGAAADDSDIHSNHATRFPCRARVPSLTEVIDMNAKLPPALAWRPMLFLNDYSDEIDGTIGFPAMNISPHTAERFVRDLLSLSEACCDDPLRPISTDGRAS